MTKKYVSVEHRQVHAKDSVLESVFICEAALGQLNPSIPGPQHNAAKESLSFGCWPLIELLDFSLPLSDLTSAIKSILYVLPVLI